MRFRANDLEFAMADGFDLMDILDMDDIVLSQAAAELEEEYMEDVLLCQAGDSPAVDVAPFDENYVAHDTIETEFDILQDVSFELGLFLEENLQHWVNTDNQHMSGKVKIEYDDRFVPPVSEKEIEELVSAKTNGNTKKNTRWSVGVFNEWRSARAKHDHKIPDLHLMDAESMDFWLQRFIMEAKKKGGDYQPKSLYYIVCGLIRHLRDMNVNDKHFLDEKDGRFAPFRRVLDAKIKDLLSKGLGTKTRKADPILHEDEELFWVNGVFGKSSATTLQYTVFFYNCKLFGLRGRDEHRNRDCDQFEIGIDSTGKFIRFIGRNNKTFKGGLGHMQLANKDIKHYSQDGPRCIIAYYEEYLKAVGSGTFYRKPLNMDGKDRFRYGKSALGVNKLHGLMRELCQKGELLGNCTNHFGKRTCATALYHAGIDEQEIMTRTGNRSTASMRAYKTSTDDGYKMKKEKKHCLNDVTTMQGGPVSFSNCNFNFN